MSNILVAYFSAGGNTKRAAQKLAEAAGAELFEIVPKVAYTRADLDWADSHSRSTVEMNDPGSRPEIAGEVDGIERYDTIFVGFPIWWYTAPTIINTFLESYDLSGKTVVPFATSGGSGMSKVSGSLSGSCNGKLVQGKLLNGSQSAASLKSWIDSVI